MIVVEGDQKVTVVEGDQKVTVVEGDQKVTIVEGNQKAPFSIATASRCRGGHYSFPWIAPLYP